MVICVLCVVLFAVAYFSYIEHKYSDGSNITKFLVGSSGSVLDDNDHINDIYIESEQQIEIISVFYEKFNEFSAIADIDLGIGSDKCSGYIESSDFRLSTDRREMGLLL